MKSLKFQAMLAMLAAGMMLSSARAGDCGCEPCDPCAKKISFSLPKLSLFNKGCGCETTCEPVCEAEPVCDPCAKKGFKLNLGGLLACPGGCESECEAEEPACETECAPEPACGCDPCGKKFSLPKIKLPKLFNKGCGCEPACGCEGGEVIIHEAPAAPVAEAPAAEVKVEAAK